MPVDHLMLNANDYERGVRFYGWLMPKIGYPKSAEYKEPEPLTGWFGDEGSVWLMQAPEALRSDSFDKRRVGIREIAFRANSRAVVDEIAKGVEAAGGKILDPAQEYPQYAPNYYSVFFTDPDGVKLEVVTYAK